MGTTGKVAITNDQINRYVLAGELDYYLSQGWRRGRKGCLPSRVPCKICGNLINPHDGRLGICRSCFVKEGYQRQLNRDPEIIEKKRKAATGLKRSDEFKRKQSEHMKQHYLDHPERRKRQGEVFSKAWRDGKHVNVPSNSVSNSHSKPEKMMFQALVNNFGEDFVTRSFFMKKGDRRQVYPDAVLYGCIAIEYNGDYYHGNPKKYKPDDIVSIDWRAEDLWEYDKIRQQFLLDADIERIVGTDISMPANILKVVVIWESDVLHLKTQEDWDTYIGQKFLGWDEYMSI